MLRVLKDGGFAFIEMSTYKKMKNWKNNIGDKLTRRRDGLYEGVVSGVEINPTTNLSKENLKELMKECKIKEYKVEIKEFGGRDRLILQFWK